MRFLHPEFLWALTALAVPIIIHLFNFRKYKTLYFSSLQFVQHVEQRSKSTQKLKNLIVLLLRLLAYAAIIFAFAQPYFNQSSSSENNGKEVIAIHIDNSFSMTMKGAEGELLSEAKESARKIIEKLPLNTKILLSTNTLDGIESRITTKIEALDRLDKIEAKPMVRSYDEVVNWQKNTLKKALESHTKHTIQYAYLSDFQKNSTKFSALKADSSSNYYPILFTPQNKSNLSIDSIWFASPLHKINVINEMSIQLRNSSNEDLQNVQLTFQSGKNKRDLFIDIKANSTAIATMSYTDKEYGNKVGKISIQDQQFFADDDYYFAYTVAKVSKITIINGEDANTSVGKIYRLDNYYQVNEISQGQYTQDALSSTNLVVLNGVNDVPSGLKSNLTDFYTNGGTIAFFPGASLNLTSVNSFLSDLNLPVINKVVSQSSRINALNYKDPFFKGVFEKEKDNLSLPAVSKFYLTSAETTTGSLDIIQLQNGKPLFLRSDGDRQAFLFTSVLNSNFGSFTSDILFTTMLLRVGELSMRNGPLALTIGEEGKYPVYTKLNSETAIHLKGENIDFIPKTEKNSGVTYIDLSGTEAIDQLKAGIYSVVSEKEIEKIALNYNRKESSIEQFSKEEILASLAEQGILNTRALEVNEGASVTNLELKKAYPYWKILIVLTLIFLLAEMLVIKFWNTQRTTEVKA